MFSISRFVAAVVVSSFAHTALAEVSIRKSSGDGAGDKDGNSGLMLPDWGTPDFGIGLGPIAGFKSQTYGDDTREDTTYQSEIGVSGFVTGIPVVPGNPGFYIKPFAGSAWGRIDGDSLDKDTQAKTDIKRKYQRLWVGSDLIFFNHWYRHTLGLSYGKKSYSDDKGNLSSFAVENDFGFALLLWTSAHFTHRYLQAKLDDFSEPFLKEQDVWLHAKLAFSLMGLDIDVGPGVTYATEVVNQGATTEQSNKGRVDYVKGVSNFDIFWKFYASASAKYVYDSTNKDTGSDAARLSLPDESLYQAPSTIMPKDSLSATELVGISDLLLGFGAGYQWQQQILHLSEKNGTTRQKTENQGLVLTYHARL